MKMTAAIAAAILAFCSCASAASLPVNVNKGSILAAEGARAQELASELTTFEPADADTLRLATRDDKTKAPKVNMAPISYSAEEVLFTQGKSCIKWTADEWRGHKGEGFAKRGAIPVCREWAVDDNRMGPYYVMRGSMMWDKKCHKGWSVQVDGQFVAVNYGKDKASESLQDTARVLFKELQGSELEVPGSIYPAVLIPGEMQRTATHPSEAELQGPDQHLPVFPGGDQVHEGVQRRSTGGLGGRGPLVIPDDLCDAELYDGTYMMSATRKTYCETCVADARPGSWPHMQECRKLYDEVMEEEEGGPITWGPSLVEHSDEHPTRMGPVAPNGYTAPEGSQRRDTISGHHSASDGIEGDTAEGGHDPTDDICTVSHDRPMSELRNRFCSCIKNPAFYFSGAVSMMCKKLGAQLEAEEDLSLKLETPKPAPSTTSTLVMKRSLAEDTETCTSTDEETSEARADFCSSGCKASGKQGIRCEKLATQVQAEDEHGIFLPAFDGMPKLNSIMPGNENKCEKLCERTADYPVTAWDRWCRTRCNGLTLIN